MTDVTLSSALNIIFIAALIIIGVLLIFCLIRSVKGPRIADRLVAVNMMGTLVIVAIAILALMLKEGFLMDIGIIYALLSFLAVIVLTRVYMGIYLEKKDREKRKEEEPDDR